MNRMFRVTGVGFLASLLVSVAAAQDTPAFLRSICLKVTPAQQMAFEKLMTDNAAPAARHRISQGRLARFALSRAVYPTGEAAECDYTIGYLSLGFPEEMAIEKSRADWKAAGAPLTYDDFLAKAGTMSRIIRTDLWIVRHSIGAWGVGDYISINRMKVKDQAAWAESEGKLWKPVQEARVQSGDLKAWATYDRLWPAGSAQPYSAVTIDAFPSWAALGKRSNIAEVVRRVHPNMSTSEFGERTSKARDMLSRDLFKVVLYERAK